MSACQVELEKKMLGKYFPVTVSIHADAATATKQLHDEIKKEKIKLDIKNITVPMCKFGCDDLF